MRLLLIITIFLLPLFFLPITFDFSYLNKQALFLISLSILTFFSLLKIIFTKKISWQTRVFDRYLIFFLLAVALSIIFVSPNKIQAVINQNFGFLTIFLIFVFYLFLSRQKSTRVFELTLSGTSFFVSLVTIAIFFQPLRNLSLPQLVEIIKNPLFSPVGSQVDLLIFTGFGLITQVMSLVENFKKRNLNLAGGSLVLVLISLASISVTLFNLFKTLPNSTLSIFKSLPPFELSWYAAVEILKNPLTLFFGAGVDNFSSVFTQVKNLSYNQSPLWEFFYFNYSQSALLHILTETGIIGLGAFLLLVYQLVKESLRTKRFIALSGYLLVILLIFPVSLISLFLLFFLISLLSIEANQQSQELSLDLSGFPSVYFGFFVFGSLFLVAFNYLFFRHYLSEVYFKLSLDDASRNNLKEVYDNQRQAIILNPYLERYHLNFSQTHLIIANNLFRNLTSATDSASISDQDRQNLAQAIDLAIKHAKDGAVALNPQKAHNWQNLGEIYKSIIGFAKDADVFAISAYQRAIILDPQNPVYRLNLGGIYYILDKFDDAINLFTQAVSLKPNWANAHYNLAWAYYQKQEFDKATNTMENVIKLLNKEKNKADWEKANQDLETFRKKLKEKEKKQTQTQEGESQLNLPQRPEGNIEPKISVPSP